jgi:hypothetical protein
MSYAGEREEKMAAGLKKLLDRMRALNKVTCTRILILPFKHACYASKFGATCFHRLLCKPQYAL